MKNKKRGFTLVELIVVIAIVAILAAIAVPTTFAMINRSKDQKGKENVVNLEQPVRSALADLGLDAVPTSSTVETILNNLVADFDKQKAKYEKDTYIKVELKKDVDILNITISAPTSNTSAPAVKEFGVKVLTAPGADATVTITAGAAGAWGAATTT